MGASRSRDTSPPNADRLAEDVASLDQGWESHNDRYVQPEYERSSYDQSGYARPEYDPPGYAPSAYPRTEYEKKIYGDDLYGVEDTAYEEEPLTEGPEELLDADGVYEADYRVVIPPSRPLETDENDNY